jgi:hypothetical protein
MYQVSLDNRTKILPQKEKKEKGKKEGRKKGRKERRKSQVI